MGANSNLYLCKISTVIVVGTSENQAYSIYTRKNYLSGKGLPVEPG